MQIRCYLAAFAVFFSLAASAQEPITIKLWPNGVPGKQTITEPEKKLELPDVDGARGHIERVTNVSDPTLTVYRAPAAKNTGAAVLVFPGGGYVRLAMDIEGTEVCRFLNDAGVTCVLVKYRVPQPNDSSRYKQPLEDAQRAMGLVRLHAKEWKIDPERIGVIGFSAGAHLSAALSNNFKARTYSAIDEADKESCRPNFAVLLYPGYLVRDKQSDTVAPEVTPTSETPPTFLVQTQDDFARVENSLFYFLALKNAKVPAEMHLYAEGGHGYGMRGTAVPVAGLWPKLMLEWLARIKMVAVAGHR